MLNEKGGKIGECCYDRCLNNEVNSLDTSNPRKWTDHCPRYRLSQTTLPDHFIHVFKEQVVITG